MRARDARGPRAAAGRRDLRSAREPRGPAQGSCARPARVSPRRGSTAHRAQAGLDRPPSPGGARPPTEPRRGSTAPPRRRSPSPPRAQRRSRRRASRSRRRSGGGRLPGERAVHGLEPIRRLLPIAPRACRAHVATRRDPAKRSARRRREGALRTPRSRGGMPRASGPHGAGKVRRRPRPGGRRGGPAHGGAPGRRAMGLRGAARGETARTTAQDPAQDPAAPCPAGRVRRQPHAPAPDRLRVGERDPRGEPARPRPLGRALGAQGPGLSGVVCARS